MKNLDYALRILGQVKVPIIFTIYGPKEVPEYWRLCESLIALLPAHILIQTFGSLHPSDVRESLAKHDLFFLPTRGENYGHVIHEALSSGLPVLISDRTPWADVEKCKVGWCCALDNASTFVATIEQVSGWGEAQHQKVADSAIEYAQNQASQTDTLERNRKLFISAMEG
ncbi:MAG: glycosyltransferase [Pseudomonadales bacterium]|nr:glycosyltransferase [Pseudomonadales bacterium]